MALPVYEEKKTQCCWLPEVPKVCVTMLSLEPDPSIPHIIIELSGIEASGIAALVYDGALVADVVNVRTPDDETLYCVTGLPLKLKVKGIVSVVDHVGDALLPPRILVQEGSRPLPRGYSLNVFIPPGFPGLELGI